ncbi:hypothetical protein MUO79_01800 [Candidatus Bathyarchaeota archaeon]|nr:hypothetical protein [Candidatus Bathyarchaeota archaeon]
MEKEEFPIGKVEYARYKQSHSDRIIHDGKAYVVQRTFTVKGFDSLLDKWNKVKVYTKILPLSEHPNKPTKSLELTVVLMRETTDYQTLRTIKGFFKSSFKIEVKDVESNIYLTYCNGLIFMNDVVRGVTCMLQLNGIPKNIRCEKIGDAIRISEAEKDALLKEGCALYEELSDGSLRTLV